jgi:L-rhamnose-H+ transport protein
MIPDPLIGVFYHWLGGLASASNFIPFRGIRRWSFEIYWIIQGLAAWIIAPLVVALLLVPDLRSILTEAPHDVVVHAILYGVAWGVGGLTFGLAIRFLGIALGYAIALGFCTAFGTLIPPLFSGQLATVASTQGGRVILLGVGVCLLAIAINGLAGYYKDRDKHATAGLDAEDRASFSKGIIVAVFAGIMSSFFAFGLAAGKPIGDIAKAHLLAQHRLDLWQNLPVLVVVLWGGFFTNAVWAIYLIIRKRSAAQFAGAPAQDAADSHSAAAPPPESAFALTQRIPPGMLVKNYLFAAMAGVIWYFQFFFYSMGQTKMGRYDFSSWTLHMASIILFAAIWGLGLKEWKGASSRSKVILGCGLALLVSSTVIVGYGNYLSAR